MQNKLTFSVRLHRHQKGGRPDLTASKIELNQPTPNRRSNPNTADDNYDSKTPRSEPSIHPRLHQA